MLQKLISFGFALVLLCHLAIGLANPLPQLGNPMAVTLPAAEEQKLGELFMQQVRQQFKLVNDPICQNYINTLGKRLVSYSTAYQQKFDFFILNAFMINAFAGPGAHVGVSSGLILLTQNESELAAVMAHEIAHVALHHIAQMMESAKVTQLAALAAMVAAIAAGAAGAGDTAGIAVAASAAGTQHMISFTRTNEQEADNVGMQILYQAGFNPQAMPDFFKIMQQKSMAYQDHVPAFLVTHPLTTTRIAESLNRAKDYPKREVKSSQLYYLFRARLRVLVSDNLATTAKYFATVSNAPDYAKQYGEALSLLYENKMQPALMIFKKLQQEYPLQSLFSMGLASTYEKLNQWQQAEKILHADYELHPDYSPLTMQYIKVLTANKNYQKAITLAETQLKNYLSAYDLLAQAQSGAGEAADAHLTYAKKLLILGDKNLAKIQLQQGLKVAKSERQRLELEALLKSLNVTTK